MCVRPVTLLLYVCKTCDFTSVMCVRPVTLLLHVCDVCKDL